MAFDAEQSMFDRENRIHKADFAPGQAGDFSLGGNNMNSFNNDPFSSGGVNLGGNDPFGGSPGGDPFASGGMGGDPFASGGMGGDPFASGGMGGDPFSQGGNFGGDPFGSGMSGGFGDPFNSGMNNGFNGQQQQQPMSDEEKFYEAAKKGGKATVNFFKDLVDSFGNVTTLYWSNFGKNTAVVSVVMIIAGVVFRMFGLKSGLSFTIGGCLSGAVGSFCWLGLAQKASQCTDEYKDGVNMGTKTEIPEDNMGFNMPAPSFDSFGDSFGGNDGFGDDFSNTSDDFGSDDEWEDSDTDEEEEEEEEWEDFDGGASQASAGMSTEEALSQFQTIDKGMYTRQYLYDNFTKVLPTMKPDFAKLVEVDEDSDEFLQWGDYLIESAEASGHNEEYLPELQRLQKNLFTMVLTCSRPRGFKADAVATELAQIYRHQDGVNADAVYAKAETVGTTCIITIFLGKSAMISLKDMMLKQQDFILNSSNYIPLVFGIDQMGKVIVADAKKLESIIITGMPRSGKSWFCQAILTQMCAFVPPTELNIYICDPKEGISDFRDFTLPHVKKFVSDDNKIVDTLRQLVKNEGPRRKKIIGDAGFVNIWDFKERYPDVKLPVIYVIVDEVVTLASRMDKDTNNEFRMLLRELISQLPALGIRAFLIPHVLNNDIIEKKTSDLVPCKISVCGDADHIEKATGSKPKDFPYKLVNKGDMAVRMPLVSSSTMYVHGPALTESNVKNSELFDYLRRIWAMLEPDEVANSRAAIGDIEHKDKETIQNFDLDTDEDIFSNSLDVSETSSVFTNTNDSGLSGFDKTAVQNDTSDNGGGDLIDLF